MGVIGGGVSVGLDSKGGRGCFCRGGGGIDLFKGSIGEFLDKEDTVTPTISGGELACMFLVGGIEVCFQVDPSLLSSRFLIPFVDGLFECASLLENINDVQNSSLVGDWVMAIVCCAADLDDMGPQIFNWGVW